MSRKRSRLSGHAFHQIAVTANRVGLEIENLKSGLVEIRRQPFAGDCHSNAVARTLAERACGGFNSGRQVRFRVARRSAVQLTEPLDFLHRNRRLAEYFAFLIRRAYSRQVQRRIDQHRSVPRGQHEPVAVGPNRIRRIVLQVFLPKLVYNRRQSHRCARMSGVRLLHSINGKRSNGVDAQLIDVLLGRNRTLLAHDGSCAGRRAPADIQDLDAPVNAPG